ncbi:MAG: FAD:protein FMN transferase, partial [Anaerolineaceae bacterium]|nr:FAD:protein FMN transferase [Anaerolineaceae bacterium]
RLMQRSGEWHRLSDGAFDAALGALVNLWGFGGGSPALPLHPEIMDALALSGWERVQLLDGERVSRPAGVQLDFGGIGKGYAVDRAVEILRQYGVSQALVNAGGEIAVLGGGWRIGIQHPRLENALLGSLELKDMAVATSGDYQQFFELDGKRYHHILNPKTGYPATGIHGVTVIAPNCTDADALATAIFVLGPDPGLALVENLPGVEALIIDNSGKIYMSKGFNGYLSKQ